MFNQHLRRCNVRFRLLQQVTIPNNNMIYLTLTDEIAGVAIIHAGYISM